MLLSAGIDLRKIRDRLGLTMRDVENASLVISQKRGSDEYLIPPSRLSDIETKGVVPSIYRFYSLAAIYRKDLKELFRLYGIDLDMIASEWPTSQPANSHIVSMERLSFTIPTKLDPGFDLNSTTDLGRMVQEWGTVPLSFLTHLAELPYTYAFIGHEDFTMYPILPPGSFVQVDESRTRVVERQWRSEYERPIYFVETREGFTCCWCSFRMNSLVLQPHPLSPAPVRVLKHPQEAEVIGQVIGVAMRLGDLLPPSDFEEPRDFPQPRPGAPLSPSSNLRAVNGEDLPPVQTRKRLG
ncbi:MAG TPA: helix-turn-helix transcriptional regulator [Terriglobales bacterium]|nr:helix-turn-helix transcriptional regulator [Terriglobales bacterium]